MRRPELTVATVDHNVPTGDRRLPIADEISARQVAALVRNAREFGIELFDLDSPEQGIVHVIGPELGLTQPGMTIVCGDSHTSTHGAFGALAFGIGTSEVEHVLATQCIVQTPAPDHGGPLHRAARSPGVAAKDLILALIRRIGTAGATGYVIEYTGEAIRGALDGRPDDGLQHVHRGGRAGRHDRPGRRRPSPTWTGRPRAPRGQAWSARVDALAAICAPIRAPATTARS